MTRRHFALVFAAFLATVGIVALLIELTTSLSHSLGQGRGLIEALYLHFRFFTILTNWAIALLLIATIGQELRRKPLPPSHLYAAALVYIVVVGSTYELLLRKTGMRHDLDFFTDLVMHDVVPSFYLAFWLGFAPKAGLTWVHAVRWLAFPAVYLVVTLAFGAFGQGYPYFFVNAETLGYGGVAVESLIFLLAFFGLGLGAVMVSRVVPRGLDSSEPLLASAQSAEGG